MRIYIRSNGNKKISITNRCFPLRRDNFSTFVISNKKKLRDKEHLSSDQIFIVKLCQYKLA